jgi:hypothetical protein
MDDELEEPLVAISNEIVIEGEFRDVGPSYRSRRGFKGRVSEYEVGDSGESGCGFILRKVFKGVSGSRFEILSTKREMKVIERWQDVVDLGVSLENLELELGKAVELSKKPNAKEREKISVFDELYDFEDERVWEENPGGLVTVFNKSLPKFLLIPAMHSLDHFSTKGVLHEILKSIFDDVKESSENYKKASEYLELLVDELDPSDETQEYGKLLAELNTGFDGVFPGASLSIKVNLSDPNTAISPKYEIKAKSNILTDMQSQGTGLSRSAVFNLLKFHAEWMERKAKAQGGEARKLIIGFEEPEIYLHPSASRLIRDFMYSLASNKTVQIIATTHSTYMIDLSKEGVKQVINHCKGVKKEFDLDERSVVSEVTSAHAFKHSQEFSKLQSDEKVYLKMLLVADERFADVFFTRRAVVFEGNTEEVALKRSISLLDDNSKRHIMSEVSFINARGKATIISISKYLTALGVSFRVIHDKDTGVEGAEKFNQPIADAAGEGNVMQIVDCVEDVLGYKAPSADKPYRAHKFIEEHWQGKLENASLGWRSVIDFLFDTSYSDDE